MSPGGRKSLFLLEGRRWHRLCFQLSIANNFPGVRSLNAAMRLPPLAAFFYRSSQHRHIDLAAAPIQVEPDRARVAVQSEIDAARAEGEAANGEPLHTGRQLRIAESD